MISWLLIALSAAGFLVSSSFGDHPASGMEHPSTRRGLIAVEGDFHGWNAIVLRSKVAALVIVPAIGRIMRFSLISSGKEQDDELPGAFWINPALDKQMKPDSEGWTNFGGDKAWPAPQSDWPKTASRGWPPPNTFDAMPYEASITEGAVRLSSPVDPAYGVRVVREIALDPQKPVMTIKTTYEKVRGAPIRVGVWTISQLRSPERVFIPLPMHSTFPEGYANFLPATPKDLRVDGRLLSLTRDSENKTMIGSDGDAILWVGDGPDLLIKNSSPEKAGEWPEKGSHAKIYANSGDQMGYVEFEMLSPLRDLKPGQSSSMTVTYTLIPRVEHDAAAEGKRVLGWN